MLLFLVALSCMHVGIPLLMACISKQEEFYLSICLMLLIMMGRQENAYY